MCTPISLFYIFMFVDYLNEDDYTTFLEQRNNNNTFISEEEAYRYLEKPITHENDEDIDELAEFFDANLDINEELSNTLNYVFKNIDENNTGYITPNELRTKLLEIKADETIIKIVTDFIDESGNDFINYTDCKKLFQLI